MKTVEPWKDWMLDLVECLAAMEKIIIKTPAIEAHSLLLKP